MLKIKKILPCWCKTVRLLATRLPTALPSSSVQRSCVRVVRQILQLRERALMRPLTCTSNLLMANQPGDKLHPPIHQLDHKQEATCPFQCVRMSMLWWVKYGRKHQRHTCPEVRKRKGKDREEWAREGKRSEQWGILAALKEVHRFSEATLAVQLKVHSESTSESN